MFMSLIEARGAMARWRGRAALGAVALFAAALTLALSAAPASAATFQAYAISGAPIPGNQSWTGSLGNDFDVNGPIIIRQLGVFDDNADGIVGTLDVHIFDLNNLGAGPMRSASIGGSGDPLQGQFRFRDIAPLVLPTGSYSVVAYGFDGIDNNANENNGDIPLVTNDGGGLITFVNSRWNSADPTVTFPTSLAVGSPGATCSGSPEACFAAGSFLFTPVPLPAALPLLAAGLAGFGALRLRKRKKAVAACRA